MAKKYCSKCAEELSADVKFCSKCGEPAEKKERNTTKTVEKEPAVKKIDKGTGKTKKAEVSQSKAPKKSNGKNKGTENATTKAMFNMINNTTDYTPEAAEKNQVEEPQIKCPRCGSTKTNVEQKTFRKASLLFGLIGAAIEGIRSRGLQYVCKDCGYTWD